MFIKFHKQTGAYLLTSNGLININKSYARMKSLYKLKQIIVTLCEKNYFRC